MREILTLLSGIAWTVVYVACIVRGFRQRTYCMPAAALAAERSQYEVLTGLGARFDRTAWG